MRKNSELRSAAQSALNGNWGTSVILIIIYLAITTILSVAVSSPLAILSPVLSNMGNIVSTLLVMPLAYAIDITFLRCVRGTDVSVGGIFSFYKSSRVWLMQILKTVYTFLWALLLLIPGIIKSYSYSMSEYILNDNPEISAEEAIQRSMAMMQGNKMKLFLLDLSFIGWFFLVILTLGIGIVLLMPYVSASHAAFYEDLKAETV